MKPIIHGRAAFYNNPLVDIYEEKEGRFKGRKLLGNVFGQTPTDLFKAANLNLTFDDSQIKTGDADTNGMFDGVYGLLQRNESDFSAMALALEALHGDFDPPVKVISLIGDTEYHAVTNPEYNRTEVHSDIEDTLAVVRPSVVLLYMILFIVIRIMIGGFKICSKSTTWKMIKLLVKQSSRVNFKHPTQLILFTTFECCIAILVVRYCNQMSADLVTYSKPLLLDTLQDILDSEHVKASFTEATNVAGLFENSPKNSTERRLYEKTVNQWSKVAPGSNLFLLSSDKMLEGPELVKKHKLALFALSIPTGLIIGLECKDIPHPDDPPLKYSSLYATKESFLKENFVIVTSLFINPELESRLAEYHTRFMASGFHERTLRKGSEMAIESISVGKEPSISCLNTKLWEATEGRKTFTPLKLESCSKFLSHLTILFVAALVSLLCERLWHTN